jgi:hypothetical protein
MTPFSIATFIACVVLSASHAFSQSVPRLPVVSTSEAAKTSNLPDLVKRFESLRTDQTGELRTRETLIAQKRSLEDQTADLSAHLSIELSNDERIRLVKSEDADEFQKLVALIERDIDDIRSQLKNILKDDRAEDEVERIGFIDDPHNQHRIEEIIPDIPTRKMVITTKAKLERQNERKVNQIRRSQQLAVDWAANSSGEVTTRIADIKGKISDRQKELSVLVEKIDSNERAIQTTDDEVSQLLLEVSNRFVQVESAIGQRAKIWYAFAGMIVVLIVGFYGIALRDVNVRLAIFKGDAGIQFITLFSLVIAIILFGLLGILEGKELAALLGGLSGYILGKGTSPAGGKAAGG